MKYYLIAGEASGDLHGASLMKELKKVDPKAEFRFWGGDLMAAEGGTLVSHFKDRSCMGFFEILTHLPQVFLNISKCKEDIADYKPDKVIFIDYAGFNLRIAPFVHKKEIETHFYISPKLWAWNEKRVNKVKACIDRMYTIFPFETEFYQKHQYEKVLYVGNPLKDYILDFKADPEFKNKHGLDERPVIALVPGSRNQEIERMLPIMLTVCSYFPEYQFVIAGAPNYNEQYYKGYLLDEEVKVVYGDTYELLKISQAALVTSGTATLETALFEVPQVVCYKTGSLNYFLAKRLIKVKYISLVNLIMDKEVVKELIQDDLNYLQLRAELDKILHGSKNRKLLLDEYHQLKEVLGPKGASKRTAIAIYKYKKS